MKLRLTHWSTLSLACLALAGCLGNSGSSTAGPPSVQTYAGDGAISISWNADPTVNYWVFHAQDPTLTTLNWTDLLGAGVLVNASSPAILCGQVNNPAPPSYFPAVYFTINGRTGSAPGGTGTALVSGAPRPAGGPQAPWVPGPSIPAQISALGYAPLTGCGYGGRPASGFFVAVGPAGTVYYSTLAPTVAGPLVTSQGNSPMVWNAANTPVGFNEALTGVAGYTAAGSTPANPSFVFVAVGRGGTVLRSLDGINWSQVNGIPTTQDLNAVASTTGSFVAVGNAGAVITSADGLTWTLNTLAATVSGNTLNAVRCAGATCVAVGTNGTVLFSYRGGSDWTLYSFGTNNWNNVAYGNNNLNADSLVSDIGGVLAFGNRAINTWVITDAAGNYAFTQTGSGTGLSTGPTPIAGSISAIDYTTRFVALDAAGNAYASETGIYWETVGASNVTSPVAMRSNTMGYVAVGATGTNASSF